MKRVRGEKKAQVWVETVIYTLIALAIIGIVLSFINPKIEAIKDRSIIEQSIAIMENIDILISEIDEGGLGNKRLVELGLKKGSLTIDGVENKLVFEIDSKDQYSEPGEDVFYGDLIVHTIKIGKSNKVTLTRDYSSKYDITYKGGNEIKSIISASTPYNLFMSNKGEDGGPLTIINFDLG